MFHHQRFFIPCISFRKKISDAGESRSKTWKDCMPKFQDDKKLLCNQYFPLLHPEIREEREWTFFWRKMQNRPGARRSELYPSQLGIVKRDSLVANSLCVPWKPKKINSQGQSRSLSRSFRDTASRGLSACRFAILCKFISAHLCFVIVASSFAINLISTFLLHELICILDFKGFGFNYDCVSRGTRSGIYLLTRSSLGCSSLRCSNLHCFHAQRSFAHQNDLFAVCPKKLYYHGFRIYVWDHCILMGHSGRFRRA